MENKKITHHCCVCGIGYISCDHCNNVQSYIPWRALTDTIDHFKIYNIVCDYRDKKITKDEAKDMLSNVDITGWETFKEGTKNIISDILKEDAMVEKIINVKTISKVNVDDN